MVGKFHKANLHSFIDSVQIENSPFNQVYSVLTTAIMQAKTTSFAHYAQKSTRNCTQTTCDHKTKVLFLDFEEILCNPAKPCKYLST
jgi:hypothetical protein